TRSGPYLSMTHGKAVYPLVFATLSVRRDHDHTREPAEHRTPRHRRAEGRRRGGARARRGRRERRQPCREGAAGTGSRRLGPALRRGACERSEEHTSELQSRGHLVCRLLLEKKNIVQTEWMSKEQRSTHVATRSTHE